MPCDGSGKNDSVNPQPTTPWDTTASPPGRVLGIDYGARRLGLAVSDPSRRIAQGLPTLHRENKRKDLHTLKSLVSAREVTLIVLGNPLHMDGTESSQSGRVREFAADLERHLGVEVVLWDERLTSVEAGRVLELSGRKPSRIPEVVDQMAAVILLQHFLDAHRTSEPATWEQEA